MKIMITLYDALGNYWAEYSCTNEEDIRMYKNEFKEFIQKNISNSIQNGYVTVEDIALEQSYHQKLYKIVDGTVRDI